MMLLKHRGFSLLEVALTLFVLGFLFTLLPLLLTNLGNMQAADPAASAADSGKNALIGFIIQHDRLPCPDTNNDGFENCNGQRSGGVPYRTLGLGHPLVNAAGFPLRYGVYQHPAASLVTPQSSYQPALLEGSTSTLNNALDFCQDLRLGVSGGLQPTEISVRSVDEAHSISTAFILVDPGTLDADNNGTPFDGINATGLVFESAGKAQSNRYDDQVQAMGFAELATRLHCPSILSRVSAATRDANAAYDMERSYSLYREFREFSKDVRAANLNMAKTKKTMAEVNALITAGMIATDIAMGAASASGAAGAAVSASNAAIAIALTVDELESTTEDVGVKEDELEIANDQLTAAQTAEANAEVYLTNRVNEVLSRDQQGWFQ